MRRFLHRVTRPVAALAGIAALFTFIFSDMQVSTHFSQAVLAAELNRGVPSFVRLMAAQSVFLHDAVMASAGSDDETFPVPRLVTVDDEQNDFVVHTPEVEYSTVDDDPGIATITVAPQSGAGYDEYAGVFVKNGTGLELDMRSFLESDIDYSPASEGAEVIIVHTHASEAFYPEGDDMYTPTDVDRTEDIRYNVVRLGVTLAEVLEARGIRVRHIQDIFDYPTYNGSYTRALAAVQKVLEEEPNARMVLDLHRDGMIAADGTVYRTVTTVGERRAAQIMIVAGTDVGGLPHPDWRQNLTFASHIYSFISERHENLMRPILLSKSRYNQHTTPMSLIIEFGTSGNTLQEAIYSTQLFGECLADFLEPFNQ